MLIISLSLIQILLLRESCSSFSLNSLSMVATDNTLIRYPWPDEKSTNDKMLFQDQSHYSYHPKEIVNHQYWQELCPPPSPKKTFFSPISFGQQPSHNQPPSSLDISITWAPDEEDPCDVARKIVQECLRSQKIDSKQDDDKFISSVEDSLAESLRTYRDFCQTHLIQQEEHRIDTKGCDRNCDCGDNDNNIDLLETPSKNNPNNRTLMKCRLVASRGNSGGKCPQFHIDHVPCRWIQTFLGPGTDIVLVDDRDSDGGVINWEAFSNSRTGEDNDEDDEDDIVSWNVKDRNKLLVDSTRANVYHSKEGEALLLAGSRWNDYAAVSSSITKPVVHKSPVCSDDQCRVLFTQDITFE
jgi:hypothetical protein